MENLTVWSLVFVALVSTSFAQEIPKYFKVGGQLELDPEFKGPALTNIVWKLQGDLVAEWIQSMNILDYYRFKDRATLDTKNGRLTMKNLTDPDQGTFTVELNHKVQPQRYIAKAILEVPEPQVVVQPLACHIDSHDNCKLRCDEVIPTGAKSVIAGAEPVTYSWREGDGEWRTGDQEIPITKAETKHIEEYSCRMNNPVSNKASKPHKNPFFVEGSTSEQESPNVALPVGLTLGAVAVAVAGFFGWRYKEQIMQRLPTSRSDNNTVKGNKSASSDGDSAPKTENVPLNPPLTPEENV